MSSMGFSAAICVLVLLAIVAIVVVGRRSAVGGGGQTHARRRRSGLSVLLGRGWVVGWAGRLDLGEIA